MFYISSDNPTEIAKLMLNVELGGRFFVKGVFVEKPIPINIFDNEDATSTVIFKPNIGFLYLDPSLCNSIFFNKLEKEIVILIEKHYQIKKILEASYNSASFTNVFGFTSLKVRFKPLSDNEIVTNYHRYILENRCIDDVFSRSSPEHFKFIWKGLTMDDFINTYMAGQNSVTNYVDYSSSIIVDTKKIWDITNEYSNKLDVLKFIKNFEIFKPPYHKIHGIDTFGAYLYTISLVHGYKANFFMRLNPRVEVPIYIPVRVDPGAYTYEQCTSCEIELFDKYYIMVYNAVQAGYEGNKPYCRICAHIARYGSEYSTLNLLYDKPDEVLIVESPKKIDDVIKQLNTKVQEYIKDWFYGTQEFIDGYRTIVGQKRWIEVSPAHLLGDLSKKVFIDDKPVICVL